MTLSIILKTQQYCKNLIASSRCHKLPFHNWQHTEEVAKNAKFLGEEEHLTTEEIQNLVIASYFHDTGFVCETFGHEEKSCDYARIFLSEHLFPVDRITSITNLIKATKMPQSPKNISQQIMCDADLAHLGKKKFVLKNLNLRKEWQFIEGRLFSDEEWKVANIQFLDSHSYFTQSAKKEFNQQKAINLNYLKNHSDLFSVG